MVGTVVGTAVAVGGGAAVDVGAVTAVGLAGTVGGSVGMGWGAGRQAKPGKEARVEKAGECLDLRHNHLPGAPTGLVGAKAVHQGLLAAFPDSRTTIEDLVAAGDRVVMRGTLTGTNTGSFMGAPPTGKSFKVATMSVFRIASGKIVEHWGVVDGTGVMQQLGLLPG